jgi:predicted nucleotidyltransferase
MALTMGYTAESFANEVRKRWGRNLLGAVVFGSAAGDDYDPKWSDINLLLVVKDMEATGTPATARAFHKWTRAGNPPPLVMDPDFIRRSADAFPIEWLDMKEKHRVIFGRDPLKTVRTDRKSLRLEIERELKVNLLRLQGKHRQVAGKPGEVRELMILSSSTFLVLFRACLRLVGARPLPPKDGAAKAVAARLKVDASAFGFIERLKARDQEARAADPEPWMIRYLKCLRSVIRRTETL